MLKKTLAAVVIVIIFVAVTGFLLPSDYDVSRSVTIDRPPKDVYPAVANLREWPNWTVWNTEKFPDMTVEYSGAESGVGARSAWKGDSSGAGSMEINKAVPGELVEYTMTIDDFSSTGRISFTEIEVGHTRVTFSMAGEMGANPFIRYMGLMMDGMMGPDFEESLKGLKEFVEEQPASDDSDDNNGKGKARGGRRGGGAASG